jgi:hypothetical protein
MELKGLINEVKFPAFMKLSVQPILASMKVGDLVHDAYGKEIGIITDVMRANIMSQSWILVYWTFLEDCTIEKPISLVIIND